MILEIGDDSFEISVAPVSTLGSLEHFEWPRVDAAGSDPPPLDVIVVVLHDLACWFECSIII